LLLTFAVHHVKGYLTEALKEKMKYLRNAKPRITKRPTQSPSASDMEEKKTKKEYVQYPSTQGRQAIAYSLANTLYI